MAVWEVRHGSLMALREILRVQAASAGVAGPLPEVETDFSRLPNDDNKEFKNGIMSASARKGCMLDLNVNMLSQEDYRDFKKPKDDSLPAPQSQVGIKHPESIQGKLENIIADTFIGLTLFCEDRVTQIGNLNINSLVANHKLSLSTEVGNGGRPSQRNLLQAYSKR